MTFITISPLFRKVFMDFGRSLALLLRRRQTQMNTQCKGKINMRRSRTVALMPLAAAIWAVACTQTGSAQGTASDVLQIDIENFVRYFEDSSDFSKFATDPNV